jgi:hypothetical protein
MEKRGGKVEDVVRSSVTYPDALGLARTGRVMIANPPDVGGHVLREPDEPCPHCAAGEGRIAARYPVYQDRPMRYGQTAEKIRVATRYLCDRGHDWTEPYSQQG